MKQFQKENLIYKNRFAIFFFAFSLLYSFIFVNRFVLWEVEEHAVYSFYAVDFSYGFASKLLPGAIFNALFGSHATRDNATLFASVLMVLFFAALSFMLQKWLNRMPEKYKQPAFILVMFYLSGSYTFSIFTKTLGLLDSFWLFFAFLFFAVLESKVLKFAIPILFAGCIFVHPAGILNYVVLMGIVLLYRISLLEDKKQKVSLLIIFALSVAAAIFFFIFFSMYEREMVVPWDEFHRKLKEHNVIYPRYYEYVFFGVDEGQQYIPDSFYEIESPVKKMFYYFYYLINLLFSYGLPNRKSLHIPSSICGFLMLLPPMAFFVRFHFKRMRESSKRLGKFCDFLMIIQFPFSFFISMLISQDFTRQYSHAFLIAFTLVLTVLFYDEEQREKFFKSFERIAHNLWFKVYFLAYFSVSIFSIY